MLSNLRKMYLSFDAWVCEWIVMAVMESSSVFIYSLQEFLQIHLFEKLIYC